MEPIDVDALVHGALEGRRLLEHPFYRRWEAGELAPHELAAYADQYRHFEAALPHFLRRLADALDPGPARAAVEANLADELAAPLPHLQLLDGFAAAVGSTGAPATAATEELVRTYDEVLADGPAAALAGLLAYECQVPEVAATKADGLRHHYGVGDEGARFWDCHTGMDADHARWTAGALAAVADDPDAVVASARLVAARWWAFLDEREAAA